MHRCTTISGMAPRQKGLLYYSRVVPEPIVRRSSTSARSALLGQVVTNHGYHHQKLEQLEREIEELRGRELESVKEALLLRTFFDNTFQFMGLLDAEGHVLEVNRAALNFAGIHKETVLGKYFWDTPWWSHSQKEREKLIASFQKAPTESLVRLEVSHLALDGTLRAIDFSLTPIRTSLGIITHIVVEGRDITDRVVVSGALEQARLEAREGRAQLASTASKLRESAQFLNSIIENLPVCVALVAKDGTVLQMNPAGLAILRAPSLNAVVGNCVYSLIDEKDRSEYIRFNESICEGAKASMRFSLKAFDGTTRKMELFSVPISFGLMGATVQLGMARDRTEDDLHEEDRGRLERQLRQAQKMEAIGTLAGGIAHDFNNILSAILGFTELARMDANSSSSNGRAFEDLSEVLRAAHRAKILVKQILTFSRRGDKEFTPQRLQPILTEVLGLLRASLPSTIVIEQNLSPECGPVMADPTQIHQVVLNLATNAQHAMQDAGGILRITLCEKLFSAEDSHHIQPGRYAQIEVSDTGIGMSPELLERIYEPYFTTREKGDGTGLGLSVVHGIVSSHGGSISVYSELEAGTVFKIFIPICQGTPETERVEISALPHGTERILLVDDEKQIVEVERRILEKLGYRVEAFSDALEALQAFRSAPESFDLVLTDMTMPSITGLTLAEVITSIRKGIPIVLCTGFTETIHDQRAQSVGIRGFVPKPITSADLAKVIRKSLDEDPLK